VHVSINQQLSFNFICKLLIDFQVNKSTGLTTKAKILCRKHN